MTYEFRFPDVGEGIHEGEVVQWKVKEGESVKADQVIAEVQTDKAMVEIPAPASGVLLKQGVREGQKIKVGDVFCVIDEAGEKPVMSDAVKPVKQKEVPFPLQQPLPPPKAEINNAKQKEDIISQMKPVLSTAQFGRISATPRIRQLARSLGIDLSQVSGTGTSGRITENDIRDAAGQAPKKEPLPSGVEVTGAKPDGFSAQKKIATVAFEKWGSILRIPMHGIRRATAEHMERAWAIPHVTHMDEADVNDLAFRREKEKAIAEKKGFRLTFLPFIAKAVIAALHAYPYFNSSIEGEDIVVKKYYNIGIAVDTSSGLMAPNVKNADKLSVLDLAKEMQALAEKCRDKTISIDELRGGTFTITNIGSFGGIMATPIINHPEASILGIGAIREKPVVRDGKIVVRKIMPLFLSFDHRIVDGAAAAKFVSEIIRHLEDPDLMLVDVV